MSWLNWIFVVRLNRYHLVRLNRINLDRLNRINLDRITHQTCASPWWCAFTAILNVVLSMLELTWVRAITFEVLTLSHDRKFPILAAFLCTERFLGSPLRSLMVNACLFAWKLVLRTATLRFLFIDSGTYTVWELLPVSEAIYPVVRVHLHAAAYIFVLVSPLVRFVLSGPWLFPRRGSGLLLGIRRFGLRHIYSELYYKLPLIIFY
jgi:hypothetical protein